MPSEHHDPASYGVTQDADPAMLVGALGDERTGLDQERDAQQPDDGTDATTGESGPAVLQRARRSGSESSNLPAPEVAQAPDPAMLVGALGDERMGLEAEPDAAADQDQVADRVEEPRRPQDEHRRGQARPVAAQAVARPSEVDDWRQTTANAETSTCRSTAVWPGIGPARDQRPSHLRHLGARSSLLLVMSLPPAARGGRQAHLANTLLTAGSLAEGRQTSAASSSRQTGQ